MRAQRGFSAAIRTQLSSYEPGQAWQPEIVSGKSRAGETQTRLITLGNLEPGPGVQPLHRE